MRPERRHNRVTLGAFILAGLLLMEGLFISQPATAQVDLLKVSGKYGSIYRTEYIYQSPPSGNDIYIYYNNMNQRSDSTLDPTELDGFVVVVKMEASDNPWKVVFGGLADI